MSKTSKQRLYEVGDEPVPGYRLTSFLGRGGFGEVWKAAAPGGTQVAIKINSLAMRGALKEFRSLMLVKKIQYPNLVPILAIWLKNEEGEILAESVFDQVDGESDTASPGTVTTETIAFVPRPEPAQLVIAMGLGHKSLADRLEECRKQGLTGIPVEELLKYMQDAARAIDYLNSPIHESSEGPRAIQHCDIKPPNILIVGDAAQVCDFGLARQTNDLRETSLALSPVYAPPELISTNSPSKSTDQYSLAISYLELRTGRLPFPENSTAHSVIQAHLNGQIDMSRLPEAERAVIQRATAKKPEARYPSVSEMVAALYEAAGLTPVAQKRRTWPWVAVACAVLALSASIVAVELGRGPQTLVLPEGFVAAATAQGVVIHDHEYPDQIVCERHGLSIPFRLVDSRRTGPFYMMENKVTNGIFARFAAENPMAVSGAEWQRGACGPQQDLGVKGRDDFPVYRVTCVQAERCARWLGGQLPSADQWDEAAGRYAVPEGKPRADDAGPFRPFDAERPTNEQVAVNRGGEGPLPAGAASHDISPLGLRDMAGNGAEWTRSPRDATEKFEPDQGAESHELLAMILRGRSYLNPDPLHYQDLEDQLQGEARRATEADCDIGFRVVLQVEEAPK